jgi:hypothetical protein
MPFANNDTAIGSAANTETTERANPHADESHAKLRAASSVAEIVIGAKDKRGAPIDYVYFKRDNYAIYRSGPHIPVAYSDTKADADEQIAALSGLLPHRDHLVNVIRDLPLENAKGNYQAQIADALFLGLEKKLEPAKAIIDEALRDALETQARIGRMVYLEWAAGMALAFAAVVIPLGGAFNHDTAGIPHLLMAVGAGAIGALLSIAIGIRSRTVAIDGNWKANAMDAGVRVLIGTISAAVLFLLLSSGVLADVQAGGVKFSGKEIIWQVAFLIGFAAGFLERLVPDLLEKSAPTPKPSTGAVPTNNGGIVSPGVSK